MDAGVGSIERVAQRKVAGMFMFKTPTQKPKFKTVGLNMSCDLIYLAAKIESGSKECK